MRRWIACASLLMLVQCGSENPPATPGQGTYSIEKLKNPDTCKDCHQVHYQEWSGSMHAYAAVDPLFLAMNDRGQREANIGNFCVNCHAPMAIPADGSTVDTKTLQALSKSESGVTCYFCHTIDKVADLHNGAVLRKDDGIMRGELSDAVPNEAHRSAYGESLNRLSSASSQACGSCHDIVTGHGAHIERTFLEWSQSAYPTADKGTQCAGCHMKRNIGELIADGPKVQGVRLRDRYEHTFHAIDKALTSFPELENQSRLADEMLKDTIGTALCVVTVGNTPSLSVILDDVKAGHHFPSGSAQDRQVWAEITAYSAGAVIFQSGLVPPGTDASSLEDDNLWLMRDCMFDANDNLTHDFWNATTFSSNTLKPLSTFDMNQQGFYQAHWIRHFPQPGSTKTVPSFPDRVVLKWWYQPFPYDVFDDLAKDLDRIGYSAAEVAEMRKKLGPRPVTDPLEWTAAKAADQEQGGIVFPNSNMTLPGIPDRAILQCVTAGSLGAAAQAQLAARHTNPKCK